MIVNHSFNDRTFPNLLRLRLLNCTILKDEPEWKSLAQVIGAGEGNGT